MSDTKKSLAFIDVFEQEPGTRPADLIGGINPGRSDHHRAPVTLSELFDDRGLPGDLAADLEALREASKVDPAQRSD